MAREQITQKDIDTEMHSASVSENLLLIKVNILQLGESINKHTKQGY